MDDNKNCGCKEGTLPDCAPLAMAYVPMQRSVKPVYSTAEALSRGTLFPGLDLPFMNMVNTGDLTGTPLGEVMALDFVAQELALYLDTHSADEEAFELYKKHSRPVQDGKGKVCEALWPADAQRSSSGSELHLD